MPDRTAALAKRLRQAPAFTERALWKLLRDRRLEHLKFRRQVPIGPYVVDFLCLRHRLIVEADGPFHEDNAAHDAERDAWLASQGFRVLRFANDMIIGQTAGVLAAIVEATAPKSERTIDPSSGPSGHLLPQGEKADLS
jgi:very-short-patch-repair endonuclease